MPSWEFFASLQNWIGGFQAQSPHQRNNSVTPNAASDVVHTQYRSCRQTICAELSLSELPIPFEHTTLRYDSFQLAEISSTHDGNYGPSIHIAQSRFQRKIGM